MMMQLAVPLAAVLTFSVTMPAIASVDSDWHSYLATLHRQQTRVYFSACRTVENGGGYLVLGTIFPIAGPEGRSFVLEVRNSKVAKTLKLGRTVVKDGRLIDPDVPPEHPQPDQISLERAEWREAKLEMKQMFLTSDEVSVANVPLCPPVP